MLGGAAVSWRSSKQSSVALSTAEAEYVALSAATQEAIWLQQIIGDLLNRDILYRDHARYTKTISCRYLAKNRQVHARKNQIKYHFIRDLEEAG